MDQLLIDSYWLYDYAAACAFRFLRQPSRPKPPRPVAKSGSAAGGSVTVAVPLILATFTSIGSWSISPPKVLESAAIRALTEPRDWAAHLVADSG